jgi:hypothetical protein
LIRWAVKLFLPKTKRLDHDLHAPKAFCILSFKAVLWQW